MLVFGPSKSHLVSTGEDDPGNIVDPVVERYVSAATDVV